MSKLTQERQGRDIGQVKQDLEGFFQGMREALAIAEGEDLESKPVLAHLRSSGKDEYRTARMLLERTFIRHWRKHLGQVRQLRESLGI